MAKAIMVASLNAALLSTNETNMFGAINNVSTESQTQASCTEDAAFTGLRVNIISGGSGTNNFRFRDAGANGQNLATRSGAGIAEDTTNTDSLSAGDLFNIAYTDTGSNSTTSWLACNVALASGYGCFLGAATFQGVVWDVASSTKFAPINGGLIADGIDTEANVAFKARGFTTFEALQVRILSNGRSNDSVFRNRINAGNGSAVITFTTGVTGLIEATGLADAITDGQTVAASCQLDTGVEDLSILFIGATLKSTDTEQDMWTQKEVARAASTTEHYVPIGGSMTGTLTDFTEAQAALKIGYAGTAKNLRCYLSANTYSVAGTLKLYQNGSPVITTTLTASGGAGWYENTSDSITFDADDVLSFALDEGTSGSATFQMIGITLAPAAAVADVGWGPFEAGKRNHMVVT